MNEEFLTQDVDILPEESTEDNSMTDIFPDAQNTETPAEGNTDEPKEASAEEGETEKPAEEKPAPTEGDNSEPDSELQELLNGLEDSTETAATATDSATDAIEGAKEKVEQMKENPESANSEQLVNDLYQEVLRTEAALQAKSVAEEVALAKVSELQTKITEMEINNAGTTTTDNPQVMILNSLFDAAVGGSDTAKGKVKSALEKVYMELFDTSIE
jgi:type VI protein secretion system component VasF